MLNEFKQFLLRGNVVDLAVGVVIGASFSTLVAALVKGLITPLIAAIAKVPDFSGLIFTLNGSKFMYGEFINALISFLLVAATIFFFIIKPMNMLMAQAKKNELKPELTTKTCPECLSAIPVKAKRCAFCSQPVV
jgi:large conductance mechanosensitive channel